MVLVEKDRKLLEVLKEILDLQDEMTVNLKENEKLRVSVCDYILDGNLLVRFNHLPTDFTYEEELKYDIENFNWDMEYSSSSNSFSLYLQGFHTIKYLVKGYNISQNSEYLDLASKLIKSWLEYEPNSKNSFTWYDHSTADRTIIMIYYILTIKKNNIAKYGQLVGEMDISLRKHADFLHDDNNYSYNNHGTMMDQALYVLSVYLSKYRSKSLQRFKDKLRINSNDEAAKYRSKSLQRLRRALKINFSNNMVNLENSPFYHCFNVNLFFNIENLLLNPFGDSLGINQSLIKKSYDFIIQCSKPDIHLPVIGDSKNHSLTFIKGFDSYRYVKDYPPLKWFLTSKESGEKPKELFKVYKKEGYAFFRNSWEKNVDEITYLSFISGFLKLAHKHADDLSFTYFSRGKDIFIDSGFFTYEQGPLRYFLVSALAHNTVVVDEQSYPLIEGDMNDTGILDYGDEEYYHYVVGKNDMYDGVNITRSLYYLKNGDIVILDDIQSHDLHKYSQYFHLNPGISVNNLDVKLENDNTKVRISEDDLNINLFQVGHCEVKFLKGNKNKPGPGLVSIGSKLEESYSLKFSLKSRNARFITYITVSDVTENRDVQCYINSNPQYGSREELVITDSKKEIKIPLLDYSRAISKDLRRVDVQNDHNLYSFTICDPGPNETFAWYILENNEKVDVIWYSENPTLKYLFTKPGEYKITYFVAEGENKYMYNLPQTITIVKEDISKSNIKNGPLKK